MKTKFFCALLCAMYIGLMGCSEKNAPEGQQSTNEPTGKNGSENGHEYVDLGLSVMWATCNVGASKPEGYGDYFAWGETSAKTTYEWGTYKYCNGREYSITKYCVDRYYGTVDNKTVLDPEDDAAHVNWGGKWRMPTQVEINELLNNCTWKWVTQNGVEGYRVTGKDGASIFLPGAGRRDNRGFVSGANSGDYWSSIVHNSSSDGYVLYIAFYDADDSSMERFIGLPIRPVFPNEKKNEPQAEHEYVDLGLPSGLKWATCNVGASKPEYAGDYFAWGETSTKTTYNWSTYKYCNGSDDSFTKYCTNSNFGTVDNKTVLELADDAAHVNWGGSWRMPTKEEFDELLNNCRSSWTTQNGVKGNLVTGKNGNSIFLPAAGYRYDSDYLCSARSNGDYWSSSLNASGSNSAYCLGFDTWNVGWGDANRYYGRSVRPVCP